MRHYKTRQMTRYWMDLFNKAGGYPTNNARPRWPERSEVQPTDCRELLGDMFILDVDNDAAFYRLAGTRLCALYGREMKNDNFIDDFAEGDVRSAGNWISNLAMDEYLALICCDAVSAQGDVVAIETIVAPLNHGGEHSRRALGLTVPLERPYWLGAVPIATQNIRSVRIVRPWEDDESTPEKITELAAFNREGDPLPVGASPIHAGFSGAALTENPMRRAHLRVIEGGRAE